MLFETLIWSIIVFFFIAIVGGGLYLYIYLRFIRPSRYFRFLIYSGKELEQHFVKKKSGKLIDNMFAYTINTYKDPTSGQMTGETYNIPINDKDGIGVRNSHGLMTYTFWKNNSSPLKLDIDGSLKTTQTSSLMYSVLNTKLFDISLAFDDGKDMKKILITILIVMGILVALAFFHQEIGQAIAGNPANATMPQVK